MEYIHKVDKRKIPVCNIMGVNIAAINMGWLIDFIKRHIKEMSGDYICVSNVHTTVTAYEDSSYREIQNGGIMAIPDGGPLSAEGRKRGYADMDRTTGPDFLREMLKISAETGYRHYFYGATQETLDKMRKNIEETYPQAVIVGMYSPPFRELTEEEECVAVENINALQPDFVWIGLGAPKQERWMYAHQGKVKGLMVGVGAAFDYVAGNIERAPEWMQESNMEWVYRLLQDPKRLFKRYIVSNTKFVLYGMIGRNENSN